MTVDEVLQALATADESYGKWGFKGDGGPQGVDCSTSLFAEAPIEVRSHLIA